MFTGNTGNHFLDERTFGEIDTHKGMTGMIQHQTAAVHAGNTHMRCTAGSG